ncbi:unnamed protein product [Amoebophrya sp. A120]|nr:unnamed protein product [Amoebophrya sp. A120]|eukprot:GSA120T00014344001.1
MLSSAAGLMREHAAAEGPMEPLWRSLVVAADGRTCGPASGYISGCRIAQVSDRPRAGAVAAERVQAAESRRPPCPPARRARWGRSAPCPRVASGVQWGNASRPLF